MSTVMDINKIKSYLPHRYPFLLVDRVIAKTDNSITSIKNVTVNEPFFQGHFPGQPIMPGVLQVEAMAQTAGLWALDKIDSAAETSVFFMTIDKVKFRKPVVPGDSLRIKVDILKFSGSRVNCQGKIYVDDKPVSEAVLMAMIKKN
ncbi:MAG TPA: 3-hydroxyacyl-ACP dehydratase FabZ [Spirochaetota bacterium]|nr:3-hydroxyacyl-ACP dehydratase FabZ [Spirochaetota bacterium]